MGISWDNENPSGYVKIAIENGHLPIISMVIFHSCVSLPEGNGDFDGDGPMGLYMVYKLSIRIM
jgi:hypothetical protein